jgi:hypothetical protein
MKKVSILPNRDSMPSKRIEPSFYGFHIFFAGHSILNHLGHAFNTGDVLVCHMYSSITGRGAVSMVGVGRGVSYT